MTTLNIIFKMFNNDIGVFQESAISMPPEDNRAMSQRYDCWFFCFLVYLLYGKCIITMLLHKKFICKFESDMLWLQISLLQENEIKDKITCPMAHIQSTCCTSMNAVVFPTHSENNYSFLQFSVILMFISTFLLNMDYT